MEEKRVKQENLKIGKKNKIIIIIKLEMSKARSSMSTLSYFIIWWDKNIMSIHSIYHYDSIIILTTFPPSRDKFIGKSMKKLGKLSKAFGSSRFKDYKSGFKT